jgi:hypothetical protein
MPFPLAGGARAGRRSDSLAEQSGRANLPVNSAEHRFGRRNHR